MFSILVYLFDHSVGQSQRAHEEGWQRGEHNISQLQSSCLIQKGGDPCQSPFTLVY